MAKFKPVLLFLFCSFSAHASIITYTDQNAWLAALPSANLVVEDFNGAADNYQANSLDNPLGNLSVSLFGGAGDPGPTGLTGKGFFQSEVDASGNDQLSIQISFDDAWGFALGGLQNDSLSSPANLNLQEIALTIGSEYWLLSDLFGTAKSDIAFLGFVSDELIDSFQFVHASQLDPSVSGTSEEFYLDQLTLALNPGNAAGSSGSSPASVAEPPALFLLLAGLFGLAYMRRSEQDSQFLRSLQI